MRRADSGLLAETEGRQAGVEGVGLQLVWLETVAQVGQVALDSSEGVRVCHRLNLAWRGVSFSDGDQPLAKFPPQDSAGSSSRTWPQAAQNEALGVLSGLLQR